MHEEAGIAALGIDWKILLAQLANFLIVFWLLKRFAFGPLIKVLEERRQKVEWSIKDAETIEIEKAASEKRVAKLMDDAQKKAQKLIKDTESSLKKERERHRLETEAQVAKMVADAKTQVESYKANAKKELSSEIGYLVVRATEKIISEDISETVKQKASQKVTELIK